MILVNTTELDRPYSTLSLVGGVGTDFTSGITARNSAISFMIQEASSLGADAIVNVKFAYTTRTTYVNMSAPTHYYDVIASGTAVKFK